MILEANLGVDTIVFYGLSIFIIINVLIIKVLSKKKDYTSKFEYKTAVYTSIYAIMLLLVYLLLYLLNNSSRINLFIFGLGAYCLVSGYYSVLYRKKINDYFDYKYGVSSIIVGIIILIYYLALPFRPMVLKYFGLE